MSLEKNTLETIESVLDNIFEEDKKTSETKFFETPKLFINDHLLTNKKKYLDNKNNEDKNEEIINNLTLINGEKIEKIFSNKNNINIEDYNKLKGNFLNLIKSQNGSRYMQKIYLNTSYEILKQIFEEISNNITELMID